MSFICSHMVKPMISGQMPMLRKCPMTGTSSGCHGISPTRVKYQSEPSVTFLNAIHSVMAVPNGMMTQPMRCGGTNANSTRPST